MKAVLGAAELQKFTIYLGKLGDYSGLEDEKAEFYLLSGVDPSRS